MRVSRYWTSGCLALVLAAAGRWPMMADRDEVELEDKGWVTMTSELPLDQTARKLRVAAREQGATVLADVPQPSGVPAGMDGALPARVLVLGGQDGHTPVYQSGESDAIDLPMKVVLEQQPDGSTRVMFNDPASMAERVALPDGALQDLTMLPAVVSAALGQHPPLRGGAPPAA